MTDPAWAFLVFAAAFAVTDWSAVTLQRETRALEYIAKPATTAALIGLAALVHPVDSSSRAWFLVALGLCLVGDVFLMLPRDAFVPGLVSFLLAHVAFIVGLSFRLSSPQWLAVSTPIVGVVTVMLGTRLVRGARASGARDLVIPLIAYVTVIATMASVALATRDAWAGAGSVLFMTSDAIIGWTRFIGPLPGHRPAIMITYHTALAALVISLAR